MAKNETIPLAVAKSAAQPKLLLQPNRLEEEWIAAAKKRYGADQFELAERAWAAGLFDGEGYASARSTQASFHCEIQQLRDNRFVLERFRRVVGVGEIRDLQQRANKNHRPASAWSVTSQSDLLQVWRIIGDFLCKAKRDQFASALSVPIRTMLDRDRVLPDGLISAEVMPDEPPGGVLND
ncbi:MULTISPECIES: hypothetical protein [unclassified Bradyrhizobium]|uniref:hypothetical protein n=1 Tax=unclassified Bradyrhizobium TaxID=2631580 RepID=UPI0028EDE831|nr:MULTISPECIES: hypothetical protein [unclassified Bradyrhizobium]